MISARVWARCCWDDYKAWRRGERRVAARGTRGRVYERVKKQEENEGDGSPLEAKRQRMVKLTARVFRKDGGPVETYDLGTKEMTNG